MPLRRNEVQEEDQNHPKFVTENWNNFLNKKWKPSYVNFCSNMFYKIGKWLTLNQKVIVGLRQKLSTIIRSRVSLQKNISQKYLGDHGDATKKTNFIGWKILVWNFPFYCLFYHEMKYP